MIMKVVDEYVDSWKPKYMEYYKGVHEKMKVIAKSEEPLTDEEVIFLRARGIKVSKSSFPSYYKILAFGFMEFGKDRALAGYVKDGNWIEVERVIDKKLDKRKEEIKKKIERKVGYLEENHLRIIKGEIRGTVKGIKKYAVKTQTMGGYNIMNMHFRLYFNEVKEKKT